MTFPLEEDKKMDGLEEQPQKEEPIVNLFFSTQEGEGKTFLCQLLIAKLCELDYKVLHITYDETDFGLSDGHYRRLLYPI